MSLRFLLQQRVPRFFVRRHFATSMKEYESLYDVLEVDPSCTKTEIREAWLKLSMKYHPDLNKDSEEAKEKFLKIKDAYKILNNEESRMKYNDQIGFHHHDPPPDYHHEGSFEGEMNKMRAREYWRWDEQKIRDLMSSERLREVNWRDLAPSERYKVLIEEENKRKEESEVVKDYETPPTPILVMRMIMVFTIVSILTAFSYRVDLIEGSDEIKDLHKSNEKKRQDIEIGNCIVYKQSLSNQTEYYSLLGGFDLNKLRQQRKEEAETQEESS